MFQSERYDCFSVADENLFSHRRHRHTGKAAANMAARDDKNGRKLMNTEQAAADQRHQQQQVEQQESSSTLSFPLGIHDRSKGQSNSLLI